MCSADAFEIDIKHILYTGGQGTIHLARSNSLDKDIILKEVVNGDILKDLRVLHLKHENIIECLGRWNRPNYLIYEYVNNGDLEYVISNDYGRLKANPLNHIEGILKGLNFIHNNDIVHLDLHPKNILVQVDLSGSFIMKICDFGLSETQNCGCFSQNVLGRPGYVSPEKVKSGEINIHTDIWSFGSILWMFLTGKEAFNFDNRHAAYYTIGNSKHPDVPHKWPVLIQKMLFLCWDSRVCSTDLLQLLENRRIKRETDAILTNQMPLLCYHLYVDCNKERIVASIEWGNINKKDVFKKYCLNVKDFESIKERFKSKIAKRKFEKIKDMMDLLVYLNEAGHFTNLKGLNDSCISKLCERKRRLIEMATALQLIKLARSLGIPDCDIDHLKTCECEYFVNEIFEFWSDCNCTVPFDIPTFNSIITKIGIIL